MIAVTRERTANPKPTNAKASREGGPGHRPKPEKTISEMLIFSFSRSLCKTRFLHWESAPWRLPRPASAQPEDIQAMPKWKKNSEFGAGRRVPLDREKRAVFLAKLKLARGPGRLTIAAVEIGRLLVNMLGKDGRLDPSIATLARLAAVNASTVTRALVRLKDCGLISWVRRLVRAADTGWQVEQASNAYVLHPSSDVHFASPVPSKMIKKTSWLEGSGWETQMASAARQLIALGVVPPMEWAQGT